MGRRDGDTAIDVLIDVGQRPGIQGGFHFGNEGSEVRQMQQTSVDGLSECSFAQTDETLVESALPGSVLRDEVPGDVVVGGVGSDAVVPLTFEGGAGELELRRIVANNLVWAATAGDKAAKAGKKLGGRKASCTLQVNGAYGEAGE